MPNSVFYSLRIALLAVVATLLVLAPSFYASLYVRSLIVESGVAAAVGVIGALFAIMLLIFVLAFAFAWTVMFLREQHHAR